MHRLPAQIFLMLTLSALPALSALPSQPVNQAPTTGATDVALIPVLESSAFSDPDLGDVHTASQWQIDDNYTFASPNFDSATETVNLTSIRVIGGSLRAGMLYFWRVRYLDGSGSWSEWSTGTHFRLIDSTALQVPADYPSVQSALNAVQEGDTILVRGGRYFENLVFPGLNLTLTSLEPTDPEVVAATILDGSRSGSVVTFTGTETEACVLSGFTITNGEAMRGGGIYGTKTHATLSYNAVVDNVLPGGPPEGGGLYQCDGLIEHNLIARNLADRGYGGGLFECLGVIRYNTISENVAAKGGGLAYCQANMHHNLVIGNRAIEKLFGDIAQGAAFYRCNGVVTNTVIVDNESDRDAGGFYYCNCSVEFCTLYRNQAYYGVSFNGCQGTIENTIIGGGINGVLNSRQPTYCCFTGWDGNGEGNFEADPRLVDFDNGDYSLAPDSPCIDAGRYSFIHEDFDGNPRGYNATNRPRGDGSDNDIGAFEFIGVATPNTPPNRPVNISPPDGTSPLGFIFDLVSSPFSDINPGDYHVASAWEISLTPGFEEIWASNDYTTDELTTMEALVDDKPLPSGKQVWWRVRYSDSYGEWSEWSVPTSFITRTGTLVRVPQDFLTIQSAIDNGINGDEIVVATGTYHENIDYLDKDLIIRSLDPTDATIVAQTTLERVATIKPTVNFSRLNAGRPTYGTLSGFTINAQGKGIACNEAVATLSYNVILDGAIYDCNGTILNNHFEGGGGIIEPYQTLIEGNTILSGGIQGDFYAQPTIRNNILTGIAGRAITECDGLIEGNTITYNAMGGIEACNGIIHNNMIAYNVSSFGAGLSHCDGLIVGNTIHHNDAVDGGGGLVSCHGEIVNNLLFDNFAPLGGGGLQNCQGTIAHNVLFNNTTEGDGGGIWYCNGRIVNNIIWSNSAKRGPQIYFSATPEYCCIQDWGGSGVGNISENPLFFDADHGDFRLQPDSPCIDAGGIIASVVTDFWGTLRGLDGVLEGRGDGSNYDIGANEFLGKELFNLLSDSDQSGWVDAADLCRFFHSRRNPEDMTGDLNSDDLVDSMDLHILLRDWHRGTDVR